MAFTDKDRETLVETATTVKMMKESHDRRLEALEAEDKVLHHRINKVRNLFIGFSTFLSALGGGITVWIRSQLIGGN